MRYSNKLILPLLLLGILSAKSQGKQVESYNDLKIISDGRNNVYAENLYFKVPLTARKKHLFRFIDKTKKAPLLLNTWIWYHGKSTSPDVFYKAHSETNWPLNNINWQWEKDHKTLNINLQSQNSDWFVTRRITLYSGKPYIKLHYILKAKKYFPRDKFVAPLVELVRNFTKASCNFKNKFSPAIPVKQLSDKKLMPSTIVQFFAPDYKRTLSVINNSNLAIKNGYEQPSVFKVRDLKKLIRIFLDNNSIPPNHYLQKGELMETELLFFLQDGATPTEANQAAAYKLAEKFNFLPDSKTLKFSKTSQLHSKASSLARLLHSDGSRTIWSESSMKKIYPATNTPSKKGQQVELFCAKNEKESFQLAIKQQQNASLTEVIVSDFKNGKSVLPAKNIKSYLLEYQTKYTVPGFYGKGTLVADKLLEIQNVLPYKFKKNIVQPLWFTVNVPHNTNAGLYKGQITLKFSDDKKLNVPVALKIWNFSLPEKYPYRAFGTIGWSSPKAQRMDYIAKMADYHISGNLLPGDSRSKMKLFDGKQVHLEEFIERAKTAVQKYNSNAIQLPNTYLGNCAWRPGKRVSFRNMDPTTKEFENAYRTYLVECSKLIRKNGLQKEIFLKVWDEVPVQAYATFKRAVAIVRQADPDFKIEVVGAPDKIIVENADIICPGAFASWWGEKADKVVQKYSNQGKEFWVYLNHMAFRTDQEAVITRLVPWMCWSRGLSGYYQWGMDAGWKGDFDQNGHTWLFYPSKKNPVPSVRLEYFRDGIEDYTYFKLLEKRSNAKNALLKEVLKLSPKFAPPELDVAKLHELRLKIGNSLEQ
jgi:hypothetical protein